MAPPLPAASRPSKMTTRRAPESRTHSCSFTNSVCSRSNSASYTSSEILRTVGGGLDFFLFFAVTGAPSLVAVLTNEWYMHAAIPNPRRPPSLSRSFQELLEGLIQQPRQHVDIAH